MPSRLLREGILDSEAVNLLGWPAEVFYRRLMSVVDDFGRFDARPAVLRTRLYPLKVEEVSDDDIADWLAQCESAGLIGLYSDGPKRFLLFRRLGSPRAKASKYPDPPTELSEHATVYRRVQTHASVPGSGSGSGSNSGTGSGKDCPEPAEPASGPPVAPLPPELPVLEIPCVGKGSKAWPLTASKVNEYGEAYPGVDVVSECRKARQWCLDNPSKQKTFGGVPAFLNRWLTKAQNAGGGSRPPPADLRGRVFDEGAEFLRRKGVQL